MLLTNYKTGKQIEIEVRPFKLGDEESFKACICDFYGDGYPYKEYFDKGILDKLCESGKLYLLCAFTSDNELVGTVGARMCDDFPGSAIMCLRVVKKKYRGFGIASLQRTMLLEYLDNRHDIKSIYVDALAHDNFSQHDLLQFGFITSGLRLQLYKADVMIPYGGYEDNDRISQTIMCKSQGAEDAGVFFCPEENKDFVSKCYLRLGVKYKFCMGKSASGVTQADVHLDTVHKSVIFIVRNAGTDFEDKSAQCIDKLRDMDIESVICYLNLTCQGAEEAYGYLKGHGFFFSGIKPLNADGEYMLMTWIPKGKIKHYLINACDDADELLKYIKKVSGE